MSQTHEYVSIAWYKDWQTWFNILSVVGILLQEASIIKVIPEAYHPLTTAIVTATNIILRFATSKRPVAMSDGETRTVKRIEKKDENA